MTFFCICSSTFSCFFAYLMNFCHYLKLDIWDIISQQLQIPALRRVVTVAVVVCLVTCLDQFYSLFPSLQPLMSLLSFCLFYSVLMLSMSIVQWSVNGQLKVGFKHLELAGFHPLPMGQCMAWVTHSKFRQSTNLIQSGQVAYQGFF